MCLGGQNVFWLTCLVLVDFNGESGEKLFSFLRFSDYQRSDTEKKTGKSLLTITVSKRKRDLWMPCFFKADVIFGSCLPACHAQGIKKRIKQFTHSSCNFTLFRPLFYCLNVRLTTSLPAVKPHTKTCHCFRIDTATIFSVFTASLDLYEQGNGCCWVQDKKS